MSYLQNLSVDNWLTIISLLFIFIGGIFGYKQWNKSIKIRRAEFLYQILDKIRFDDNIVEAMYSIDYNTKWYNEQFHNSEIEVKIDNLFFYIDYICYLKKTGNISDREFQIFRYKIHRICISNSSKMYLWNLYHFSLRNKTECSFYNLIDYGVKNKLFPPDFKTNQKLYEKILNW